MRAYIDESGQRSRSAASSDHFVMSAALFFDEQELSADKLLEDIRLATGRLPGQHLHWKNFKPDVRLSASTVLGGADHKVGFLSVVVCKRHLQADSSFTEDDAYLLTFRYLLERLSWVARINSADLDYTLAHIQRFSLAKLRAYEARLANMSPGLCSVDWRHVPKGGNIDQPKRLKYLQLADFIASATGNAFEPDQMGNCHPEYLGAFVNRLWRHNGKLTTYGLKMHPWNDSTKAAYPWIAAL
ncbi:DUF3800 domain-containing protein [Pseudarthrobacter sp. PH31-O2]|uniref:DUF3800 domain-containing protein n=1 Tax=Pseudarthrobacter sp. PH31-O2 TaxID=3046206 RepID=UPI0024BBE2B6|nr:DUF3800 domain-containing protein [Pseudarthrobacter sp. PH31-O2]MDJ0354390.1 DUF3800 domain-containing protein [Pseudarthrobacter sp. PH31-O2]